MKKILISGYYGFDNFGDEAILSVLLKHLKGHQVTVLSADPEKTYKQHNVHSINSFKPEVVLSKIYDYDLLISGGGSLLQNVTSNNSLIFYTSLIKMFTAARKDAIIFAQGIGPVNGFWGKHIAKSAIKKCKYVSVRDENSQNLLKSWGIKSELVCDPFFDVYLSSPNKTKKVGIQLRKFSTITDKLFDEIIRELAQRFSNREIELISLQDSEDVGISQIFQNKIKAKYPTMKVSIAQNLTMEQLKNRVGEYDYLIAMRYHACLLGLKYGIKTLAISYDPKVETLAKEANIPYLSMNNDDNDYKLEFDKMEKLTSFNLLNYVNSKYFDWSKTGIDEILNS